MQGTEASPQEWVEICIRAISHFTIDQLPLEAFAELLPALLDTSKFYSAAIPPPPRQISATKPAKLLSRTVRPPVEFPEE
jgi:hypothetical protein